MTSFGRRATQLLKETLETGASGAFGCGFLPATGAAKQIEKNKIASLSEFSPSFSPASRSSLCTARSAASTEVSPSVSAASARAWARLASRRWRSAASSRLASKSVADGFAVVAAVAAAPRAAPMLLSPRVPVLVAAVFRRERLRSGGRCFPSMVYFSLSLSKQRIGGKEEREIFEGECFLSFVT